MCGTLLHQFLRTTVLWQDTQQQYIAQQSVALYQPPIRQSLGRYPELLPSLTRLHQVVGLPHLGIRCTWIQMQNEKCSQLQRVICNIRVCLWLY